MSDSQRPAVAALTAGARAEFLMALATNPVQSLTSDQAMAQIGAPIPIVWGRREIDETEGEIGGVWVSPQATEISFQNDNQNNITVSYQLVLSDGRVSNVQPGEFWQGTEQKGQVLQSYNARAGNWSPGNFTEQKYKVETYNYQQSVTGKEWTGSIFGKTIVSADDFNTSILANITLTSRGNFVTSYTVSPQKKQQYGAAFFGPSSLLSFTLNQSNSGNASLYYSLGQTRRFLRGYTFKRDPSTTENRIVVSLREEGIGYSDPFILGSAGVQGPADYTLEIAETNSIPIPLPSVANFCGTGDGSYLNLSTLSFVCSYVAGSTDWKQQVWIFLRGGVEASRLIEAGTGPSPWLPDLVRYLALKTGQITEEQLDIDSLTLAARFNKSMRLRFNGELKTAVNLRDFLNRIAPFFLSIVQDRGGKLGLVPAHPINASYRLETEPIAPLLTLNESQIVPGTFNPKWNNSASRQPVSLVVTYKAQPSNAPAYDRVIEIPPAINADTAPLVQIDLREFCCSTLHALTVGLWNQARRIHVTHVINDLQILPEYDSDILNLIVGSVIQVNYPRLPSIGASSVHSYLYLVLDIKTDQYGNTFLNLEHFPVDNENRSLIALTVLGRLPTVQARSAKIGIRKFDGFIGSGVLLQPATTRLVIFANPGIFTTASIVGQSKAIRINPTSSFYFGLFSPAYKEDILSLSPAFYFDFSDWPTVTTSGSEITGISDQGSLGWNLVKSGTGPTLAGWGSNKNCADWGSDGHNNSLKYVHSGSPVNVAQVFFVLDANFGSTFPTYNGLISVLSGFSFAVAGASGQAGFTTQISAWFNFASLNGSSTNQITSVLPGLNSRCVLMLRRTDNASCLLDNGLQIGNDRDVPNRGWGGLVGMAVGFSTVQSEANTSNIIDSLLTGWSV